MQIDVSPRPQKLPLYILASNCTKSAHCTCKIKQFRLDGAGKVCVQITDLIQPRKMPALVW